MQQLDQARQSLASIGYQINSIGAGGRVEPLPVKQAIQSLADALTALANAIELIDERTKKK